MSESRSLQWPIIRLHMISISLVPSWSVFILPFHKPDLDMNIPENSQSIGRWMCEPTVVYPCLVTKPKWLASSGHECGVTVFSEGDRSGDHMAYCPHGILGNSQQSQVQLSLWGGEQEDNKEQGWRKRHTETLRLQMRFWFAGDQRFATDPEVEFMSDCSIPLALITSSVLFCSSTSRGSLIMIIKIVTVVLVIIIKARVIIQRRRLLP